MSSDGKEINIKIILIGDSSVGKTTLLYRYIDNEIPDDIGQTLTLDNKVKTIDIKGLKTKIQIWDTAGQEKFNSLTKQLFRNTDGIIILFDLTNKKTFHSIKNWIEDVKNNSDHKIKKLILGNKCDKKDSIKVTNDDINNLLQKKKLKYMEVSALDGTNVEKAFDLLIRSIIGDRTNEQLLEDFGINEQFVSLSGSTFNNINQETKKKCCK